MQKEIIVNSTPYEVRIAILEDKELVELLIERAESKRMVGDIYRGVVTAVLPGIQAAFVDIGTEKAAFLHVSDVVDPHVEDDDEAPSRPANGRQPLPAIQDLLHKGQEILVQVTKEPIATKGPRITTQISLPVTWLAAEEARKTITCAIRSGVAGVPSVNGTRPPAYSTRGRICATCRSSVFSPRFVAVQPGQTALSRTPYGANSSASILTSTTCAAFETE